MNDIPPPKQIGPVKELALTGQLMPWKNSQPVLLNMQGVGPDTFYLPLFEEEDQLRSVLVGIEFESIKMVEDGAEFLDSIPLDVIVITNLRFTEEGNVRFHQVQR